MARTEGESRAHGEAQLDSIIERIGHFLPSQGPLKTFVHHNTLHHFESQEFFDAVDKASEIFSANTAFTETTYQDLYYSGRIDMSDINRALVEHSLDGSPWLLGVSRRKMVRSLFFSAPVPLTAETLRWRLLEKRYLEHFHYEVSASKVNHITASDARVPEATLRTWLDAYGRIVEDWHQEWLHELVDVHDLMHNPQQSWSVADSIKLLWIASIVIAHDVLEMRPDFGSNHRKPVICSAIEEAVNPYLIKFTSSFLDAGLAHLTISDRARGLLPSFFAHMRNSSLARPAWLRGDLSGHESLTATEVVAKVLRERGIPEAEWEAYLLSKALILKGWGGLVRQSELGIPGIAYRAHLRDFLAVRLILEELAEKHYREFPQFQPHYAEDGETFELMRPGLSDVADEATRIRTTAYHLFHAFQLLPWSGSEVLGLNGPERAALIALICRYDSPERLRVWHKAYEWNLYSRTVAAIVSVNRDRERIKDRPPLCQVVCCIDDREESFRRYLEEINEDYETFGTAGFFGVDAEFHSLYERPAPFCPVNIVPTHQISVTARKGSEEKLKGLQRVKTLQSDVEMFIESHSRSFVRGWLLALGGVVALVPLSLSTLAPRWLHRFRLYLKKTLLNPSDESAIVFAAEEGEPTEGRFTRDEMVHRVKTLLLSSGLSKRLAPIVVVMGHGSFSTNNPYRSAYDCGACGGRPGRLNPRVFALMANRKDVREKVREQGIDIPDATYFVGAFHNTTTDAVEYFDIEGLSVENRKIFDKFRADVEVARAQNALERCRRFDDAEVRTVEEAIAHVESRAHHIAQPRPEYGHATNAMCIVGRRQITKGLFLDRRAFLVSYDKTVDPDLSALRNLLRAVIPVCMGINLEYFFSALDNQKYGAGTKLPHNVTSLLGLMTGYCSDLRTGLPAQMVEIHEATRLLVVLEQEPDQVLRVLELEPMLDQLVKNRWIMLMAYSPESNEMFYFDHTNAFQKFEEKMVGLQSVPSSLQWVLGKKGHLEFVRIGGWS
jgi:hypothetical protein